MHMCDYVTSLNINTHVCLLTITQMAHICAQLVTQYEGSIYVLTLRRQKKQHNI